MPRWSPSERSPNVHIPPQAEALLAGLPESGTVDAHGIQTDCAGIVARAGGRSVWLPITGNEVRLRTQMRARITLRGPAAPAPSYSMSHIRHLRHRSDTAKSLILLLRVGDVGLVGVF